MQEDRLRKNIFQHGSFITDEMESGNPCCTSKLVKSCFAIHGESKSPHVLVHTSSICQLKKGQQSQQTL